MASIYSQAAILLFLCTVASMSTVSSANGGWFWGPFNCTWPFRHRCQHPPPPPRSLPRPLRSPPPPRSLPRPPPSPPPPRSLPCPHPSSSPPPPRWLPHPPPSPPPPRSLPRPPPSPPPPRRLPRPPRSPPPPRSLPRPPPSPPPPQSLPPPPPSPSPPPPLSPPPPSVPPQSPRKIIVGGSENWRFGFDYNNWILKNSPFYLNDILVFKYDPPSSATLPHSVYLLSNKRSFFNCDLRRAQKLANWTQGGGDGFEFVLKQQKPYFFACGESNGFHCINGTMKFSVTPTIRGSI